MGKPSFELLPSGSPFVPALLCKLKAINFFSIKEVVKLLCCTFIHNDSVFLVVPTKTPCIEVSTAHCAYTTVNCNNFRVVESGLIHPYITARFHQFMCIVKATVGG